LQHVQEHVFEQAVKRVLQHRAAEGGQGRPRLGRSLQHPHGVNGGNADDGEALIADPRPKVLRHDAVVLLLFELLLLLLLLLLF
jgi:hypothetical protein